MCSNKKTGKTGHAQRKVSRLNTATPFVPVCMVTCFRLRVFDAFTFSVYMFTFVYTALPRSATRFATHFSPSSIE